MPCAATAALFAAASATALILPSSGVATSAAHSIARRELLGKLVCGGSLAAFALQASPQVATAASARTGLSSVFTGEYDDPKHPGCLRSIKVVGNQMGPDGRRRREPLALVKGVDQTAGLKAACNGEPELASVWKLDGKVSETGDKIFIDFSPKGGPKDLIGTWDTFDRPGILFPDGNKWVKVEGGTPERRPRTQTLSSD